MIVVSQRPPPPPPSRVHRTFLRGLAICRCLHMYKCTVYTYLIPVSNDAACILVFCRGGVICGLHPCEPNKCQHQTCFCLSSNCTAKSGVTPARMASVYSLLIYVGVLYSQSAPCSTVLYMQILYIPVCPVCMLLFLYL